MGLWSRIKRTFRSGNHSAEIEEELQFHLHMDTAEGREARMAHLRLGNLARIQEETRGAGTVEWLHSVLQDAWYGWRQIRKTPALTAAVVLSIAIGVGANTAIFSLVDAAILRPLPVADPDALAVLDWRVQVFPQAASNINGTYGPAPDGRMRGSSVGVNIYRRMARERGAFSSLAGEGAAGGAAISVDGSPAVQGRMQYVSANYFQTLGALPTMGRPFVEADDRVGAEPVVIISHRFWLEKLGGARDILDRAIRINNVPARITGVAPEGFFGLRAGRWNDFYSPLAARVAFQPPSPDGTPRAEDENDWWVWMIGRLKPGETPQSAASSLAVPFRSLTTPEGQTVDPKRIPELAAAPGRRGFEALRPRDSNALWILMALVGVLLLIVCANVANLLLSRSVTRQRESGVRLALGAARTRLFRQHLIESSVFALLGGGAGVALGYLLAQSIHALFQSGNNASEAFDLTLDPRVLFFAGGLSIVTALLFGLAPALRAARAEVGEVLKTQTRTISTGRLRLPRILVAVQIGLCLTALVAAGLLTRSLENLHSMDIGFERHNIVYATVEPGRTGFRLERVEPTVRAVRDELSRIPGVVSVSTTQIRPLSGSGNVMRANIPGIASNTAPGVMDPNVAVFQHRVGPGYFETLQIPVLLGRPLEARDMQADSDAVVVDEMFARRYFPDGALGRRFGLTQQRNDQYQIVGVVENSGYNSLRDDARPTVYQPLLPWVHAIHFAIRTRSDSERLEPAARKVMASIDPAMTVTEFYTQTGLIDRLLRTERMLGFLSSAFGLIALLLSAIGLAGLLAYAVARRTNEIGVRMALGAAAGDVIGMVLRDSLGIVALGILIGLPGAYAVGQWLQSALFRLEPLDLGAAGLAFSALVAAAVLAAWVPARRASRIEPMAALREE